MSLHDRIMEQAAETVKRYKATPWVPRGILASEGLALCTMVDLYGTLAVIETGYANGRSTEILRVNGGDFGQTVIDWEIDGRTIGLLTDKCIYAINEDARKELPRMLAELCGEDIVGVFIDGPKGMEAVKLAAECIQQPHVQWVGVHDVSRALHYDTRRAILGCDAPAGALFWATDQGLFSQAYSWLDVNDSQWDEEQGTRWFPFNRLERDKPPRPYGSYGYTIGFLCKTPPSQ